MATTRGRGGDGGVRRCSRGSARVASRGIARMGVGARRAENAASDARGSRRAASTEGACLLFQERSAAQDDVRGVDHGAEPRVHAPLPTLAAVARATPNRNSTRACPARRLLNLRPMGFLPSFEREENLAKRTSDRPAKFFLMAHGELDQSVSGRFAAPLFVPWPSFFINASTPTGT